MNSSGDDNSASVQNPLLQDTEAGTFHGKIIAFVNPKSYVTICYKYLCQGLRLRFFSGGLQGQVVLEQLVAQIGEQNVYDLVKDHGPQKGLKDNQGEKNLRIIGLLLSYIFFPSYKRLFLNSMWW